MKTLLDAFAQYNRWAHQRLLTCIGQLSPEQQVQEIESSFSSLYKTILHVWGSETIWFARVQGAPKRIEGDPFKGSIQLLSDALLQVDQQWLDWVAQKNDASLMQELSYQNLRGEHFRQPFYQLLQHIFNHSTYHNGQLVTILHQVGVSELPATDFIVWTRESKQ
jgi:uncharacterized damage-inducible protein DinB